MKMIKKRNESFRNYIARIKKGILRRMVTSVKERERLERMIGPVGYWHKIQQYQFNFLCTMGLKPYHSLLDIGCGPLSGGLVFIPYLEPGNYAGIDIRSESITEAYIQLAKANLAHKNPFLAVSTTFGRDELLERKYDYIWASQMLYHLDEKQLDTLFQQLSYRLKPGGKFYGDVLDENVNITSSCKWYEFSYYLHSPVLLSDIADKYGLEATCYGRIISFGYPAIGNLQNNYVFELWKKQPA